MINYELLENEIQALGIEVAQYTPERLDAYAERLVRWNKHINLTAITDPDEILIKHFIDSLTVLKYVDIPDESDLIDVGTGAGFPALPLLIAKPSLNVTFLDSVSKKLNFIKDVLRVNGLIAKTVSKRAEELARDSYFRDHYDFATARAVAELNSLCEYCLPLVKVGGRFIALKGANGPEELEAARNAIEVLGGELEASHAFTLSNGDQRYIYVIKKISQTPTKYPRRAKKIDTKPL